MKRKIYLIRHGQPHFPYGLKYCIGHTDFPLSTLGRLQSCQVAATFRGQHLKVFSSPLVRALDTANHIRACPYVIDELIEQHMGEWEGMSFQAIQNDYPELYLERGGNPYLDVPGSESIDSMAERFRLGLQEALDMSRGDIIVVAHCAVILSFVCSVLGDKSFFLPENKQSYTGRYVLTYEDGEYTVELPHTRPIPELDRELAMKMLLAVGLPWSVVDHCKAVAAEAEAIALELAEAGHELDTELVYCGALLHDLARNRPEHPQTAANWLRELGYERAAEVVRLHHQLERPVVDEAAVVFIADKLYIGNEKVSIARRFENARTKCDSDEAFAALEQREADACGLRFRINRICKKEIIV